MIEKAWYPAYFQPSQLVTIYSL